MLNADMPPQVSYLTEVAPSQHHCFMRQLFNKPLQHRLCYFGKPVSVDGLHFASLLPDRYPKSQWREKQKAALRELCPVSICREWC